MNLAPLVLEVPALADGRLRLRPWTPDDAPALVAAWHDPAVLAGSLPPEDRSEAAARRWIEGAEDRRRAGVALDLVVADDDTILGEVGLSRLDPARRAAMVGWWVGADHRRRGVATTAVRLVVDWAVGAAGLRAVVAEIGADNEASARVAASAGLLELRPATADRPAVWARRR